MRAVILALSLALTPVTAVAQYYGPCSPNPLAWPFCAAGAIVVGATAIVAAPFVILSGGPHYAYGYPPPYYPPPVQYVPTPMAPPALEYHPPAPPLAAPVTPPPQAPMYYAPRG
jgi:hypothetical protein